MWTAIGGPCCVLLESVGVLESFQMMEYMRDLLPDTMVIHAGHRPGLERFHDREIHLVREKRGGPATAQERHLTPRELLSRALYRLGHRRSA